MMAVPYKEQVRNRSLCAWMEPEAGRASATPTDPSSPFESGDAHTLTAKTPHRYPPFARGGRVTKEEAIEMATEKVRKLDPGTEFTSQDLLPGTRLRGDPRGWAAIINALRRKHMIVSAGLTRETRRTGTAGFTCLWRVTREDHWEE